MLDDQQVARAALVQVSGVGMLGVQRVGGHNSPFQVHAVQQGDDHRDVGSAARRGASLSWSFSARPPAELTVRVSPQ